MTAAVDTPLWIFHLPGQHNQQSHGGDGGEADFDDGDGAEAARQLEGEYGFGVDPAGVSYTEFDVDEETGQPKFSAAYRETQGPLIADTGPLGKSGLVVAIGEKRGIHVADDSAGTMHRQVVQEFTPRQSRAASKGIYDVYNGDRDSFTGSGIDVRPAGPNPTRDGVRITWANGRQIRLEGESGDDEAFDLQGALDISDRAIKASALWQFGTASPVTAAARKPRTVSGPSLQELDDAADQMAALVAAHLGRVAGFAARNLGGLTVAASAAEPEPLWAFHLPGKHDQSSHGRGGGTAAMDDEATIRSTFGYRDKKTGMTAEVTHIVHDRHSTEAQITVKDRNGNVVGDAMRTVQPGQKTVRHDGMHLEPGVQGQGFATRFNAHAEESYRAHGIERITTNANIDVGGYSHARAGYDFDGHRGTVEARAMVHSIRNPSTKAEIDRLINNPNSTPADFAEIGHTAGATTWPGKEILLGSHWPGVKVLT